MTHSDASTHRRGRIAAKAAAFALVLVAPAMLFAGTSQAAHGFNCTGTFSGKTPDAPDQRVSLSPGVSSVVAGTTVTYTIGWTPNGASAIDIDLCFRVGDGSNATLNALVEHFSVNLDSGANTGTRQVVVTFPNNPALYGLDIVARAKCTKGCEESKSEFNSLTINPPVVPSPTPTPTPTDEPSPTPTPTPTVDPTPDPTPTVDPTPDPTPTVDPTVDPTIEPSVLPSIVPTPSVDEEPETETRVLSEERTRPAPKAAKPKALAETGSETTAAWLGVFFLALGIAVRSVRFRPLRAVAAGTSGIAPVAAPSLGFDIVPASRRSAMRIIRRAIQPASGRRRR